jgi:hypothetical protein
MRWFWQKKNDRDKEGGESDRVRVFDFGTEQIITMPAAELAPGMVKARLEGIEGEVWIDSSHLKKNVFQHPPFDEEVRNHLREIKSALDEVYPMSLEQWEDGFRRDRTPEREIAYWLHLAQTYSRLTASNAGLGGTLERRQAIFKVLVGCGVGPREQVLAVADRGSLTREEAERVVAAFYGDGSHRSEHF